MLFSTPAIGKVTLIINTLPFFCDVYTIILTLMMKTHNELDPINCEFYQSRNKTIITNKKQNETKIE